jgi:hypothetical protein
MTWTGTYLQEKSKTPTERWFSAVIGVIIIVAAVYIATQCNRGKGPLKPILAGLFPEIYLTQHAIRRMYDEKDEYCTGVEYMGPRGAATA